MGEQFPVDVLLVGYEDQTNLGLRSIAAVLNERGYQARLVQYATGSRQVVLDAIQESRPRLIGFSIIFQYALDDFTELMKFLREAGVTQHFTAGGHFPTLQPEEVLDAVPYLDSIVCCEGEFTTVELLEKLDRPREWEQIQGIAFRQAGKVIRTPPRPLIEDLDRLPFIIHGKPDTVCKDIKMMPILASRGCQFNCSFCSIRQFYASAPGPLRRNHSPQRIVEELKLLYERDGVRFFIFQDDDFAARTPAQRRWLAAFLQEMDRAGLSNQVAWKISCRVDDLDEEVLAACQQRGLSIVYLGVESGSPAGLQALNKHVTVEQNLAAIRLLKKMQLGIGIGFMLFDPSTTFDTIQENIDFLREAAGDGAFPVNFCKMMPYAGTPIQKTLKEAGRLSGSLARPDYNFLDPQVDIYAYLVMRVFSKRNFDVLGLVNRLKLAQSTQVLTRALRLFGPGEDAALSANEETLREITARSNEVALSVLEDLMAAVKAGQPEQDVLLDLATREWKCEADSTVALDDLLLRSNPELLVLFGNVIKLQEKALVGNQI